MSTNLKKTPKRTQLIMTITDKNKAVVEEAKRRFPMLKDNQLVKVALVALLKTNITSPEIRDLAESKEKIKILKLKQPIEV